MSLYRSRITAGGRLHLLESTSVSGRDSKASSPSSVYCLTATGSSLRSGKTGTIPLPRLFAFYHNIFSFGGKGGGVDFFMVIDNAWQYSLNGGVF